MNKTILTVVGFGFLIVGFVSLVLTLVGVRFTFLAFLDEIGSGLFSLLAKILFILFGFILIYVSKTSDI